MEQRPILGRHPARGLVNRLPNNTSDGAALGILGAGGALPDGWTLAGMPAGTVEIVSLAPKNGRPNIRLRLNGTPTGTVFLNTVGTSDFIEATVGQTWTSSAWIQRVGGSTNNITNLAFTLFSFAGGTPVGGSLGNNLRDIVDMDGRRATMFQITDQSADRVTQYLRIAATGTIDITLDVSSPQIEQGPQPSGLQIARANGFDVTEAGQSSLWYLQPDGVDDWMQFTTPFNAGGGYSVAVAANGAVNPVFGATTSAAGTMRYQTHAAGAAGSQLRNDITGAGSLVADDPAFLQRHIHLTRVSSANTAEVWVNGAPAGTILQGTQTPAQSDALFRFGATHASGRLYGAALIDTALSDINRIRLQNHLSKLAGVSV